MDGSVNSTDRARRNPTIIERPPVELRRRLGEVPILVIDPDRARSWLGAGIVPPTLLVERGHEAATLSSGALARLLRLRVPILLRLADWREVTRWAGHQIVLPASTP